MLGYSDPLYILPFDHRSSFSKKIFGYNPPLTKKQIKNIIGYKEIVFDAFLSVYNKYDKKSNLGILVDEQFGKDILIKRRGG